MKVNQSSQHCKDAVLLLLLLVLFVSKWSNWDTIS